MAQARGLAARVSSFFQQRGISPAAGYGFLALLLVAAALLAIIPFALQQAAGSQELRALVLSSGGVVQGATVEVFSPDGSLLATGVSGADGKVAFDRKFSSSGRVTLKVSKQGFVSASGERQAISVVDLSRNKLASLELYSSQVEGGNFEGGLAFLVLDRLSRQPVSGASINAVFAGQSAVLSTDSQGKAILLQVPSGATVRVKVSATGYYSDSRAFAAIRPEETILVTPRTAQTVSFSEDEIPSAPAPVALLSSNSLLEVSSQDRESFSMPQSRLVITDSAGNPVASGTVSILSSSGQEIASAPIADGVAGTSDLPVSSGFSVIVSTSSAGAANGVLQSGSVQVFDAATNNKVLTALLTSGSASLSPSSVQPASPTQATIALSAQSIDGTPVQVSFTVDSPSSSSQRCAGTACTLTLQAGQVTVTASAPGFASETVSASVSGGQLLPITFQLVNSTEQLRVSFSGAQDSQGKAVSSLLAGHDYFLKFSLYSAATDETVFSLRLGEGQSVSSEGFGVLEFDASEGGFSFATKSVSYSPQPTCVDLNNGNSKEGLYKWVQLFFDNKGSPVHRIISIPVRVRSNSPASMPVFYRLQGKSGTSFSRTPLDAALGSLENSPSKAGCYASENRLDLRIGLSNSCSDGTREGQCSDNVPFSCQRSVTGGLQLSESAGCCPVGTILSNGQCVSTQLQQAGHCADGTAQGQCSLLNKPRACIGGLLLPSSSCCKTGEQFDGAACRKSGASCQIASFIFPDGACLPSKPGKCSDGVEVQDSSACGCPAGTTQRGNSCSGGLVSSAVCSDATSSGACSAARPRQCLAVGGSLRLVNNALACGCPDGQISNGVECRARSQTTEELAASPTCSCAPYYSPVCGDGKTYDNICFAQCAGAVSVQEGACVSSSAPTPVVPSIGIGTGVFAPVSCAFPNSCLDKGNSDDYCNSRGTVGQACLACNRECGGNSLLQCNSATNSCQPKKCLLPAPGGTAVEQCVQANSPARCAIDLLGNAILRDSSSQCGCPAGQKPDASGVGCMPCADAQCTDAPQTCRDADGAWHAPNECLPEKFSRTIGAGIGTTSEAILKCNPGGQTTPDVLACGCPSGFKRQQDNSKCVLENTAASAQVSLSPDLTCAGCVEKDTIFLDSATGQLKTISGKKVYYMQADDVFPADAFLLEVDSASIGAFRLSVQGFESAAQTEGCYDYDSGSGKVVFRVRNGCPIEVRGNGFVHTGTGQPVSSDKVTIVLRLETVPLQDLRLELNLNLISLASLLVQPVSVSGANTRQLTYVLNNKQTIFGPRTLSIESASQAAVQSSSPTPSPQASVASANSINLAGEKLSTVSLATQSNEMPGAGVKVLAWAGPGSLSISELGTPVATLSYDNTRPSYFVCQDRLGGGRIQGSESCAGDPNCCTLGWCNGDAFKGMFGAFKEYSRNTAQQSAFRRGVDRQGKPEPYTLISAGQPFELSTAAQVIDGSQRIVAGEGITLSHFESCGNFSRPGVYQIKSITTNGKDFKYAASVAYLQKFDYVDGTTCDDSKFVYDASLARPDLRAQPLCEFLTGGCGCIDKSARSHVLDNNQNKDPFALLAALPLLAALAPLLDKQGKMMQCQNDPNWNRDTNRRKQMQDQSRQDAQDDLAGQGQQIDPKDAEQQKKIEELAKKYGQLPDQLTSAFIALTNDELKSLEQIKSELGNDAKKIEEETKKRDDIESALHNSGDFLGRQGILPTKVGEKQPLRLKELDDSYAYARKKTNELCAPLEGSSDRFKARIQLNGAGKVKNWIDEEVATGTRRENLNEKYVDVTPFFDGMIPFALDKTVYSKDGKLVEAIDECEDAPHSENSDEALRKFCWSDQKVKKTLTGLHTGISTAITGAKAACVIKCTAKAVATAFSPLALNAETCSQACEEYERAARKQLSERLGDPAKIEAYAKSVEEALKPKAVTPPPVGVPPLTSPVGSPLPSPSPAIPAAPPTSTPSPVPPAANCMEAIVRELSSGNECEVYNKKLAGAENVKGLLVEQFGPLLRRTAWFVDYAYGSFAGGDKVDSKHGGRCVAVCQKKDRFEHLFGAGNKIFSVDRYGLDENCMPLAPLLKDKIPRDDPNKLYKFVQDYLSKDIAIPTATPRPPVQQNRQNGNNIGSGNAAGTAAIHYCIYCQQNSQDYRNRLAALRQSLTAKGFSVTETGDLSVPQGKLYAVTNRGVINGAPQDFSSDRAVLYPLEKVPLSTTVESFSKVQLEGAVPTPLPKVVIKGCVACGGVRETEDGPVVSEGMEAFFEALPASYSEAISQARKAIVSKGTITASKPFVSSDDKLTIQETGDFTALRAVVDGKELDKPAKLASVFSGAPILPADEKKPASFEPPNKPEGFKEWKSPFDPNKNDRPLGGAAWAKGDPLSPGSGLLVTLGKPDPANANGDYVHFTYDDLVKAEINAPAAVAGSNKNENKKVPGKTKLEDLRKISKGDKSAKDYNVALSRDESACVDVFVKAFKEAPGKKVKAATTPDNTAKDVQKTADPSGSKSADKAPITAIQSVNDNEVRQQLAAKGININYPMKQSDLNEVLGRQQDTYKFDDRIRQTKTLKWLLIDGVGNGKYQLTGGNRLGSIPISYDALTYDGQVYRLSPDAQQRLAALSKV